MKFENESVILESKQDLGDAHILLGEVVLGQGKRSEFHTLPPDSTINEYPYKLPQLTGALIINRLTEKFSTELESQEAWDIHSAQSARLFDLVD